MNKIKHTILIIALIFASCLSTSDCDCYSDMENVEDLYGIPDDTDYYDDREDWIYYTEGLEYTFEWGTNTDQCCEVSKYLIRAVCGDPRKPDRILIDYHVHYINQF
jgi:hypothetical protein